MKDFINVREFERIHKIRWGELVELEPELDGLLNFARLVGNGCRNFWDVERSWGQFKKEIAGLVGYFGKHRRHPILGTVAAYEVVYWKLHNAVAKDEGGD